MAEEKKETTDNVVLKKFKRDQAKENKNKKWNKVSSAVHAAQDAYTGGWGETGLEKIETVSYEKALGDLIEVLQKIKSGDIKLSGLGNEGGLEVAEEG